MAENNKIIQAIKTNCLNKLNKNLKNKAKKILQIDGTNCDVYL